MPLWQGTHLAEQGPVISAAMLHGQATSVQQHCGSHNNCGSSGRYDLKRWQEEKKGSAAAARRQRSGGKPGVVGRPGQLSRPEPAGLRLQSLLCPLPGTVASVGWEGKATCIHHSSAEAVEAVRCSSFFNSTWPPMADNHIDSGMLSIQGAGQWSSTCCTAF